MYQHVFDYKRQFHFLDVILKRYECHKILELAYGSGLAAGYFIDACYDYHGVDFSKDLLRIASKTEPRGNLCMET